MKKYILHFEHVSGERYPLELSAPNMIQALGLALLRGYNVNDVVMIELAP